MKNIHNEESVGGSNSWKSSLSSSKFCSSKQSDTNPFPYSSPQYNNTIDTAIMSNTKEEEDDDIVVVVDLMCPCGSGCCNILISNTSRNRRRKFYRCPLYGPKACKFFKWCDELLFTGPPPSCPCGAGLCCVIIQQQQHCTPFYYFVCPIKKGQGSCNFIQPVDATIYIKGEHSIKNSNSSPKSTLTHCFSGETTTWSTSFSTVTDKTIADDEISDISFQLLDSESSLALTPQQHSPYRHRHHKRMRRRDPEYDDVFVNDSVFDHDFDMVGAHLEEVPFTDTILIKASDSVLTTEEEFWVQQAEFYCDILSPDRPDTLPQAADSAACDYGSSPVIENCLEPTLACQILGFRVEGWCGQLVFPPACSLRLPAPRPFFCCVFPSFDPIFVPEDDNVNGTDSSNLTGDCAQLLGDGIVKISLENDNNSFNIMSESIVDVFKQAAACLKEGLVNRLQSMKPHEHEAMVQEAHLVFKALDNLSVVDYHSFKERVMRFINCAVSLSKLESSSVVNKEGCVEQESVDSCNRLHLELEDISILCAEADADLSASNNHLSLLIQEEARIKEMLYNVQAEMLCCRVENDEINRRLTKMTQERHNTEMNAEAAKKKVDDAHRLRREREEERDMAKVSFEQARCKLRDREIHM